MNLRSFAVGVVFALLAGATYVALMPFGPKNSAPSAVATTGVATSTAEAEGRNRALPRRFNCGAIAAGFSNGTYYRSSTEYQWFLANCRPTPTPVRAVPTAAAVQARPPPTLTPRPAPTSLSAMIRQVRPGVVRIDTPSGVGSGVIVIAQNQEAYIITNYHVIEGYGSVDVTVNDAATYSGTVWIASPEVDLAVVRICCGSFHKLTLGNAGTLAPGDEVVTMGYALGLGGAATVTKGIVSAVRYDSGLDAWVIQTDAAMNPGNSGGPMLSLAGEVLGINTFGLSGEGLGFAIAESAVRELIADARQ